MFKLILVCALMATLALTDAQFYYGGKGGGFINQGLGRFNGLGNFNNFQNRGGRFLGGAGGFINNGFGLQNGLNSGFGAGNFQHGLLGQNLAFQGGFNGGNYGYW